jgi:hypothetical protein
MKRNDSKLKPRHADKRGGNQTTEQEAAEQSHRLRGADFTDDFADAESDSCVVARRRDEKESDS